MRYCKLLTTIMAVLWTSLCGGVSGARAQSAAFAPVGTEGAGGTTVAVGFAMTNSVPVRDMQWSITLPAGVETVYNNMGQPLLTAAADRVSAHTFSASVKPQPDGSTRINVAGVSLSGATIAAGSGEVVSLTVKLTGDPGEYTVRTSDVHLSDASSADIACAAASATVTILPSPEEVSGLTISSSALTLRVNETATLTAEVQPATAVNKSVTWQSSDRSVATVANGIVTGVSAGTATITATASNGITVECVVTVTAAAVTSVSVSPASISLVPGESSTLTAVTLPSNADAGALTWSSGDAGVVTVDGNGRITAIGTGTTDVTASTADGVSGACRVTVENPHVSRLTMVPSEATVMKGRTANLKVEIQPSSISTVFLTWTSSDESVATVDDRGTVTGVSAGTVTITASEPNGVSASATVTVEDDAAASASLQVPAIEMFCGDEDNLSISLTNSLALRDGQLSITLPAGVTVLTDERTGAPKVMASDRLAAHSVSASIKGQVLTVAMLSLNGGNITGLDGLLLTVPFKADAAPGSYNVTVGNIHFSDNFGRDVPVADMQVALLCKEKSRYPETVAFEPAQVSVTHRSSMTIAPVFTPANATDKTLEWTSSDPATVSVDANGQITAEGVGSAEITATSPGGASAKCTVTVEEIAVASVAVSPAESKMYVNATQTLTATVMPVSASFPEVTWSSSDEHVATVSADGTVKAVGGGVAVITATTRSGAKGECRLTVQYDPSARKFALTATSDDSDYSRLTASYALDNSEPVRDMQFRLTMPGRFTADMVNPSSLVALADRAATHTVSASKVADTPLTYQVVIVSLAGQPLKGTSGELFSVVLDASSIGKGSYVLTASDIHVSNTEGRDFIIPDVEVTFGVEATEVQLTPASLKLKVGEQSTIAAVVLPENASDKTVTWLSSDESVAAVDATGNVTATGKGSATITATCGSVSATCAVTVDYADATDIVVADGSDLGDIFTDGLNLFVGDSRTLELTVVPSTAAPVITVTSSDDAVLSVDGMTVTATGEGTATVTVSCGSFSKTLTVTVKPVVAASIALDKTSATLKIGDELALTATVLPENVTDPTVIWISSDETVATVDANGKVTATGKGSATITATCGSVSATCAVTVDYADATDIVVADGSDLGDIFTNGLDLLVGDSRTLELTVVPSTASPVITIESSDDAVLSVDGMTVTATGEGTATVIVSCGSFSKTLTVTVKPVVASSVKVEPASVSLKIGEEKTLTVTIEPENVTDKTVVWTSSDESVAAVDADGKVIALGNGIVTITATCGEVSGTCEVSIGYADATDIVVADGSDLGDIFTNGLDLLVGDSRTLELMVVPTTASPVITVTSSDDAVLSVDGMTVTATGEGTATVTVSCGSFSKTFTVTVKPVVAASIALDKTSATLKIGDELALTATVLPENVTDPTVIWTSSDETVATVDANGKVTAIGKGSATITATCGSVSATCAVTVDYADVTDIVVADGSDLGDIFTDGLDLLVGDSRTLELTVVPSTASPVITVTSSDDAVLSVDGMTVTATGEGIASVIVSCGSFSKTFTVTVKPVVAASIALDKTSATLKIGDELALTATVLPENVTDPTVNWTSSDETVATVDANGKVTATGKGSATITATCGSVSATCAVTVDYADATDIVVADGSDLGDIFTDGLDLLVGDSRTLELTVVPSTASPVITVESSDNTVVAVDGMTLTAIGEGSANITVSCGNVTKTFSVTVSRLSQTITWHQTFDSVKEGDTVTLTAEASSGLPVEYTVITGDATLSGSDLTVNGSGEIWVEASQSGDNKYQAAAPVVKSFNAVSGIGLITGDDNSITLRGNELIINHGEFGIYNLRGMLLRSGIAPERVTLDPGQAYIVRVGNRSMKLIVK